jgi:hypothetical protein
MDREKLIKSIMKDLECTREEAEEVAEMEIKAKGIKRYEKAEEQKPRKKREVKLDEEKVAIIDFVWGCMLNNTHLMELENINVSNPQKEITFKIGQSEYSLTLTKHRPPKK